VTVWPDRVCIMEVPSHSGLRRTHKPGETWPLTTGGTGCAYLAHVSDQEVQAALEARPLATQRALDDFHRTLAMAKATGIAIPRESEHIAGMQGMAAAVLGRDGMPVAMISISGPANRWTQERMSQFAARLSAAARDLSITCGFDPASELPASD
jgi:IclR family acetate operon transcriptional repressor